MNIYTVSVFGHRKIENFKSVEKLALTIEELIRTKPYVSFFVGRNGEFDVYAASVIKEMQRKLGKENADISLILPYAAAELAYYEKYYDFVTIPEELYGVHPKAAITLRNRWMIERSDMVIVYVEHTSGGACAAMKYAEKLNKKIINLCGA